VTTGKCVGCLGSGTCWVCLGSGFADTERRRGSCSRCHGTRHCHVCNATAVTTKAEQRRVLVVDDEPDTLHLVELWIADDPRCEAVDVADSGDRALLVLAEADPDTIVCDHNLGSHTSNEYLPGFKSAAPDARIVIHTSDPLGAKADGVLDRGADVVVEKGTSLEDLVDIALGSAAPGIAR